jgi:hypothetical protein
MAFVSMETSLQHLRHTYEFALNLQSLLLLQLIYLKDSDLPFFSRCFFSQTFLKSLCFVFSFLLFFVSSKTPFSQTILRLHFLLFIVWIYCVGQVIGILVLSLSSVSCHILGFFQCAGQLVYKLQLSFSSVSCHIPSVVLVCGIAGLHTLIQFSSVFYHSWYDFSVQDNWLA